LNIRDKTHGGRKMLKVIWAYRVIYI
jgi:hypothetical protein